MGPCSCLLSSFVIWPPLICLNHLMGNSEKEEGENHFSSDRLFLLTVAAAKKKGFSWKKHDAKCGNLFHSHLLNVIMAVKYFISWMVLKSSSFTALIQSSPYLWIPSCSGLWRSPPDFLADVSPFHTPFQLADSFSCTNTHKKTTPVSPRGRIKI